MRVKKSLMLWVAVIALALPLVLVGTASAKYNGDGAVPDGTGGWVTPNDGICVVGLHVDGTMDIADGITSKRDCIYLTKGTMNGGTGFDLTSLTTAATCTDGTAAGTFGGNGARHAWASSCVDAQGNGISLKDLDRTTQMCTAKGGTMRSVCTPYTWTYRGVNAAGTPIATGTKGVDASSNMGFCYTTMRTNIAVGSCPTIPGSANGSKTATSTEAFGYSVSGSFCVYAYGVNGPVNAAMAKSDYTSYAAAGATMDLTALATQGDCLANGGSWNNWGMTKPTAGFTTANGITAAIFDLKRQSVNADDGCLHCHSSKDQANGPAERQKDSFLKTGHKNMLRKVTAGQSWAGPNASGVLEVYTASAVGAIDFTLATAATPTVYDLLYIFGDWMAPAPGGLDVIVNRGGLAKYNGTSNYSCAACHTEGWSNPGPGTCSNASATSLGSADQATCEAAGKVWTDPGICSLSSKKSQSACTTAGGTWYPTIGVQAIGTPGYTGAQPGDAYSATFQGAGVWDNDGISCGRCHNAAWPQVSATQIAASQFPTTDPVGQNGMGSLNKGVLRTKLCFGCHQSMAATSNGTGVDVDLNNPTALIVKNAATAPAYTPMFSGHVLGNSFLNSPHARFTGVVVPNSLGKYDIATSASNTWTTAANYNSTFRGYTCWQSTSSTSPAKTNADGTEIKTKTECENLYGAGAWRPDQGVYNGGASDIQGTCTTCHDVHNSLFVTGQEGLRKECVSCHDNSDFNAAVAGTFQASVINHPTGAGTPAAEDPADPCVVCHMPKPTAADFPMHVWRINSDPTYSTFPTAAEFGIGAAATLKNARTAVDSKGYTNAVWVDVDLACGQCHNGAVVEAPVLSKVQLAAAAKTMHDGTAYVADATKNGDCTICHTTIVPGTNHHGVNVACESCHARSTGPKHHTKPDQTSNTFCLGCHTNSGPYAVHHAVAGLSATCQSCHTIPGVTVPLTAPYTTQAAVTAACQSCHASAQGTKRAIVVSGAGDNHHNGSGTKTSALGSQYDRQVAGCVYCHNLGKPFGDVSTEAIQDQRFTGSCSGACHTSLIQSNPTWTTGTQNHHNGDCRVCHAPTGPAPAGVTTPAFPPANVADCTACHSAPPMTGTRSVAMGAGTNHKQGTTFTPSTCDTCHVNAGIKPTAATCSTQCHADPAKAPVLDSAVLGGYLAGMHDPKAVVVNHAPVALGLRTAYTGTSFASPTIVTNNTNAVAFTDASTDEDANVKTVTVSWGDGAVSSATTTGTFFTHNYTRAGTYQIIHTVKDNGGLGNTERAFVKIAPPIYAVTGTVSASGSPLSGAIVYLKLAGHTRAIARTAANGTYTFPRVLPGSYTITTVKKGYTFSTVVTVDVTGAATADITAD